MKNFSKFDKSFNINKISTYYLILEISMTSYRYCIMDIIRKQYVAIVHKNFEKTITLYNYLKKLKSFIKDDVYLNKNYKKVDLIFFNNKFTLIPDEFFDKKMLKQYFKFNNILNEHEEIHFNKIKQAKLSNVFTIPSDITTYLVNQFPEIRFLHQGTPLIEYYTENTKESKSTIPTVILNIYKSSFEFSAVQSGKLLYYNYFKYKTDDDLVYFILNTFNQLDFDVNKVETIIHGSIEGDSSLHKNIKKYLSIVKFGKSIKDFTYNFIDVPEHFFQINI